ncbi:MAG: COR domain-containing protein [Bacteroidota bacterium]
MLDWYAANKKKLAEIKVILIGDPKAGKTSLLKKLKDDDFNENEPQTDGINIEDIVFESCATFEEYKALHGLTAHFWDFGGQEIMNATHQFFLTNRSVYILVLDARKDSNVSTQVRQWVKRIKNTSGNSSIIVVANQIDVNPGFGFENERELQEEFPEIKYFIKASCKEGTEIATIKEKLAELIPKAELFDTEIDERWINIKEKLQQELDTKTEKYLDEKRFNEICEEYDLNETRQRLNAIQFLHDLGILLHFKEIDTHTYFVLDPYWITYGVYQILTSKKAGELNGLIPMSELDFIINVEEDKKESYQPTKLEKIKYLNNDRRFLVEVLNQFKLCFYQPDKKKFIIPDLLSTVEPTTETKRVREAHGGIHFVYEYEYLLKSIIPRVMVEQHQLIKERWRTGCVLEKGNCQAVISSYQHRITISVSGEHPEKREFMSILRHHLDTINSTLTDKPDMLIPLPGTKEFADYDVLLDMEKDGERYYTLRKPIKKKYLISELLEGIERKDRYHHIEGMMEEVLSNQEDAKTARAEIIDNQLVIISQLNEQYNFLINQPGNEELQENLLIEMAKLNDEQTEAIAESMMEMISLQFESSEEIIDAKFQEAYRVLKDTDDTQLKLKVGLPLGNLLGLNIEGELDIKNWSKKMYDKYSWPLFKVLGRLK